MFIEKSPKVLHSGAIAVRQEKLALERSSAAQAQGGETAEVPQPGTPAHDPRDDSPTPRPGSQSPAKPREAENASTILPLNGSAGRDTPNRLDGAQGTPNDSTHGARGAVVGAHRVDRGDDDGHRAESAREAHGDEDGNVSGQEGTSATRAEVASDEDVGTPDAGLESPPVRTKRPSFPEIEIGKINSETGEVLEGCEECLRALYDSGFALGGFRPCVEHLEELKKKSTKCSNESCECKQYDGYGQLYQESLTKRFKRTRYLRFDRTKDGLCRKCYDAPRNKVPAGAKRKAGQAVQEARQRAMSVPRLVQGTVLLPCYISVTLNDLDSTKLGDLEYISSRLDAQSIRKAICNVEEIAKDIEKQVTDAQFKVTQRGDGNSYFA
jgi:hypothetical protein